jgi:hypothetical protein
MEQHLPDLVIYDSEGRPDALKYGRLALYLLATVKAQQERIAGLDQKIEVLERQSQHQPGGREFKL